SQPKKASGPPNISILKALLFSSNSYPFFASVSHEKPRISLWFGLGVLAAIPFVNIILIPIGVSAGFILSAGGLVFMIIGIVHAVSGEYKPLPWIGHFRLLN
ncbi:MAG: hypothetical protein ABSA83_17435, partial [Verrucomicrobiota bacterium]